MCVTFASSGPLVCRVKNKKVYVLGVCEGTPADNVDGTRCRYGTESTAFSEVTWFRLLTAFMTVHGSPSACFLL